MAAQPQQNIRAFLNSSVKRAFAEAKIALKEEAKKKIQELRAQIPTPDVIMAKMQALGCNPKIKRKIEKVYNFLSRILKKIIKILDKVIEFFNKILQKFKDIKDIILKKISNPGHESSDNEKPGILDRLTPAIDLLNNILRIAPLTLQALPAPPPGVPGQAGLIQRLSKAIKDGEDKVGVYLACITGFPISVRRLINKTAKFELIINTIKSSINQIRDKVQQILLFLEFLYLMFFTDCNFPGEQIDEDGEGVEVTAEDILLEGADLENLTDDISFALAQYHEALALQGQQQISERLFALKFDMISQDFSVDYMKGYRVKLISPFSLT